MQPCSVKRCFNALPARRSARVCRRRRGCVRRIRLTSFINPLGNHRDFFRRAERSPEWHLRESVAAAVRFQRAVQERLNQIGICSAGWILLDDSVLDQHQASRGGCAQFCRRTPGKMLGLVFAEQIGGAVLIDPIRHRLVQDSFYLREGYRHKSTVSVMAPAKVTGEPGVQVHSGGSAKGCG